MSDVCEDLRQYLLTQSAVTDVVGSRIYPDHPPQNASTPFVIYELVDGEPEDNVGATAENTALSRIELTCVADTRKASAALDKAIRLDGSLENYTGTMNSRYVDMVFAEGARYIETTPIDGSDNHRYGTVRQYRVFHDDDS